MIQTICTNCDKYFEAPPDYVEKTIDCPRCGVKVRFDAEHPIKLALQTPPPPPLPEIGGQPNILVVERSTVSNRFDRSRSKPRSNLFSLLSLLLMAFVGGFFFGQYRTLNMVKPHLKDGVEYGHSFALPWYEPPKPRNPPKRKTVPPKRKPEVPRPDRRLGLGIESVQPKSESHKLSLKGSVSKQKPIPLFEERELERSGWGNDFNLDDISAESTTVIDGQLVYLWKLKITNNKNSIVMADITVRLVDEDENSVGGRSTARVTLAPNETRTIESRISIDPSLEHSVDSIKADVKSL